MQVSPQDDAKVGVKDERRVEKKDQVAGEEWQDATPKSTEQDK